VIEDYEIDAGGSGSGIEIQSTNLYLIIRNCTSVNSQLVWPNAGILLYSSDNVNVTNCSVSNNLFGIYLYDAYNNIISNNTVSDNNYPGIGVDYSNDNTISNNNISSEVDYAGMYVYSSNNSIISSNNVSNNGWGISLSNSNFNNLSENVVSNNLFTGFFLRNSNNNTYSSNNISKTDMGIYMDYSYNNTFTFNNLVEDGMMILAAFSNYIDTTNLVNDNPINYYENQNGLNFNGLSDIGQLMLVNCNDSNILNSNFSNSAGILLSDCKNSTISGNTLSNNIQSIVLQYSDNNTIAENNISNSQWYGIDLTFSVDNVVTRNNISYNYWGSFVLYFSERNEISRNIVAFNEQHGFLLDGNSFDNKIWLNHISDNGVREAIDDGGSNEWDNGFVGNYWGNYLENYSGASNIGGIWDTPYEIFGAGNSEDRFPLVNTPVLEDVIPSAQFTADITLIDPGQGIQFNDTSTSGNPPLSYQWDFGDGTANSTEINPAHEYDSPGNYTVTLTVTDLDGDVSTIAKSDYITVIDLLPEADFTANATLIDLTGNIVEFTFTGTDGDGVTTFQWNFGDETANSTEKNPVHQYNSAGSYTVILTVTDADGDTDVIVKTDYIVVQAEETPTTPAIPGYSFAWLFIFGLIGIGILGRKIRSKNKRKIRSP
jgi:parallel beta-helix repeat protein